MFDAVPPDYFREHETVPEFWLTSVEEIDELLDHRVKRGEVRTLGTTAGGRPIRAVFYGAPRQGRGTTTFTGSLGCRNVTTYLGPDHEKSVYLGLSAVHGGELEGVAGTTNLISVLETGTDLRGKAWPQVTAAAERLDRIILIPLVNVDGRARTPLRRQPHRGQDSTVAEYLNTGGKLDGTGIGWPQCKEFIPMDFSTVGYPGGYPNDAGVNIQHDDFFSRNRQPETDALLDLCEAERPDLIINMHTGAPRNNYFMRMHRPFAEPALTPVFEDLYRHVHRRLTEQGLQSTDDPELEGDPSKAPQGVYNLDTALNLHCGALSALIESASHGFSGTNRAGEEMVQTLDLIVDAQLAAHGAAMEFLADTGGRSSWTPPRK